MNMLQAAARLTPDPNADRILRADIGSLAGSGVRRLVDEAESHGVAPLLRHRLKALGVLEGNLLAPLLASLAVRHREASRVQTAALLEIATALDTRGIEAVFLKGAVLAHDLYPSPDLRPRRDIDLLVAPADAVASVATLRDLGYDGGPPDGPASGRHHHLPGLSASRQGFVVAVEVHTDVLSFDQPVRMPLRCVRHSLRRVPVGESSVLALGLDDMLVHVAAHLLQPARETRLINVVDLVEFAVAQRSIIDWDRLRRVSPRTVITLSLMHYLVGLPDVLAWARPLAPAPQGVGTNIPILSSLDWSTTGVWRTLAKLLYPSSWWMHAFYGVAPDRSLAPVRWTRHAPRVAGLLLRRMRNRPG